MKYADGPTTEATARVAAPPERVWELVSDIHLVASISTELQEVSWLGPGPSNLNAAIEAMPDKEERIVAHRLREWRAGIDANLAAIKELAEK